MRYPASPEFSSRMHITHTHFHFLIKLFSLHYIEYIVKMEGIEGRLGLFLRGWSHVFFSWLLSEHQAALFQLKRECKEEVEKLHVSDHIIYTKCMYFAPYVNAVIHLEWNTRVWHDVFLTHFKMVHYGFICAFYVGTIRAELDSSNTRLSKGMAKNCRFLN